MKVPESVKYDSLRHVVYVSNINGKPAEKNGKGFISKLTVDGKIIKLKWITGLNAPKGMALYQNHLFVTDIDQLVKIDIIKGRIEKRFQAPGALFLNDAAVDRNGTIYISDTSERHSVIYRWAKDTISVWVKNPQIKSPNGLFLSNNELYVGNSGDGRIKQIDLKTAALKPLYNIGHGIDGLIKMKSGAFLISDWSGRTEYVESSGKIHLLNDTRKEHINSADLEYIARKQLILIPTFFDNRVVALRLIMQ